MSEASADREDKFDIREQIARIDRNQAEIQKFSAEIQKFSAETLKLSAESQKLSAESQKLAAEARKFDRERFLAPVLAAGALGGLIATALPVLLRAWGLH